MWERGLSSACGFINDPLLDFDSSGQCYFTGNGYYFLWSSLILETTELTSPAFDLADKEAVVQYALWYSNHVPRYTSYVGHQDTFKVYLSTDGGTNWSLVQTVGPVELSDGGWYMYSLRLNGPLSADTRLRFVAADALPQSIVEAAVDALEVITFDCNAEPPCCIGTTGNVNMTGVIDLVDLSALVSYLTGGGYVLPCMDAANVNGVGIVDLSDLSALVSYLTGGGYNLPDCP